MRCGWGLRWPDAVLWVALAAPLVLGTTVELVAGLVLLTAAVLLFRRFPVWTLCALVAAALVLAPTVTNPPWLWPLAAGVFGLYDWFVLVLVVVLGPWLLGRYPRLRAELAGVGLERAALLERARIARDMPYRTFLPAVLVGATGWCALHIGLGAAVGETARRVEKLVGTGSMIAAVAVVVVLPAQAVRNREASVRGWRLAFPA
ncbi:hypothetical protein ACSHWB_41810 [Lentzea sp. HUAS TT2]|uniref:hypothetical protein n=1 Tax=Lentzea sp. HUAS TT2 TaxID=3447454 RepID=UPI003F71829D